ncbi:glutamate--cysteine ligase catalytic subunit-like [Paramacrobiotus metropolitanus]|uniref:glutamate--cysteine ligase catalytic subunit-like n=1 Tax=Paramacrobiotus metropolitanus TaxID=2943436 RepID=UPI002445EBA7|nr:glutamate--cysteine ligase catalytic subunit-like [Paramacrobiotus metropolitanus]
MGLLSEGSPLSWEETRQYADHIRKHGIKQFINIYHKLKDRTNDQLKWGDEIEYIMVHFDDASQRAQLLLKAHEVLPKLQHKEHEAIEKGENVQLHSLWRPEYADYMIEGTPGQPYGSYLHCFNQVENNMRRRRHEAQKMLDANSAVITFTAFPRLGCPDFTFPSAKTDPIDGVSRSLFFPDEAIFPGHPRFSTLTRNIRQRRGKKVAINVPAFIDKKTPRPLVEDYIPLGDDGEAKRAAKPDHIYMDAMGFGMGCCCLQVTFQACNIDEGRFLYDQLTALCPILLSVSAAAPIFRGHLADVDCRWSVISGSVDDRTDEERGVEPLKAARFRIPKSRYDSVDCYISPMGERYNDIKMVVDEDLLKEMVDNGIDRQLALHMAHLFVRDPVSVFSEKINQDDENETDHFENLQSTNWQTMRFKPPPPNSPIGWRVEFRPMEIQMTDFENAAFVVFIVLLTRVIVSFQLNFLIPMSKVEENMKEAQKRDAARQGRFHFRKDIVAGTTESPSCKKCARPSKDEYTQMSINEIFNGIPGVFPGLIPLIKDYLKDVDLDVDTSCTLQTYLRFMRKKASGELQTTARWLRDFVEQHADYKQDGVVSEKINYDLMKACEAVARGDVFDPKLHIKRVRPPGQDQDAELSDDDLLNGQ